MSLSLFRKGVSYVGLILIPPPTIDMGHMIRHRAEAKATGTVESGVVTLRVHVPPLFLILSSTINWCFNMAPKKPAATAEIALIPLKNCLVNLPPSLVSLLVNANTVSILAVVAQ
jgi:hypothetical protein